MPREVPESLPDLGLFFALRFSACSVTCCLLFATLLILLFRKTDTIIRNTPRNILNTQYTIVNMALKKLMSVGIITRNASTQMNAYSKKKDIIGK